MDEATPQVTPTLQEKAARTPLGSRGKAQTNETKIRIVGVGTRVPILDVAAFNSFIG